MASPFKLFRKYQGVLLAVFGVALMIAFVVFPVIIQMQQSGTGRGGSGSDAVFTWVKGDMTAQDIGERRGVVQMTRQFLFKLLEAAREKDDKAQVPQQAQRVLQFLSDDSPRGVVDTMVAAEKARQMGVVISDATVYQFLYELTNNVLSQTEIDQIYEFWREERRQAKASYLPKASLLATLREALLAYQLDQMARAGLETTTPAEAWEYHNRINRRVTAEFVPFEVDDYVSMVTAEPTTAELKKLYEEHKFDNPLPNSAEPGFHRPKQVEFHYVMGDLDDYVNQEKSKFTRQQVEQYYKEHKEDFLIPDFGDLDFGGTTSGGGADSDDPRRAVPKPPQVDEGAPAGGDGADSSTEENGPTPTDGENPPTKAPAESDQPESGGSQGVQGEEGDQGQAGGNASNEFDTDLTLNGGDDDLLLPGELPDRRAKYKPLEEVEDQIRTRLANEVASQRLDAALEKAEDALRDYLNGPYSDYELELGPKPEDFDHKALATKLGLSSGGTGLVDIFTLSQDQSQQDFLNSYRQRGAQFDNLYDIAYEKDSRPYEPIRTENGNKQFLAWVVDSKEAYVPEFDEVREEVVKAWKHQQARELAREAAESLAKKIDGDQPLKGQVPADKRVLTPPAFTYIDQISMMRFRFGQLNQLPDLAVIRSGTEDIDDEPIEDASTDAIKAKVARMKVGEVEVIPNQAKSIYYVVRVASDSIDNEDDMREEFIQNIVDNPLGEGPPLEARIVGGRTKQEPYFQWYEELHDEFRVKRLDQEYFSRGQSLR